MRKNSIRVFLLVSTLTLLNGFEQAQADISWSGNYRIEGVKIKGSELNSQQLRKNYLLHHLVLQPKLVATDGLNIYGRFDILNNDNTSFGAQNLAGQTFGTGSNPTAPSNTTPGATTTQPNTYSDMQNPNSPIWVTQLYATWTQEFGVLVVGRAPLRFGLGMTYSDGSGLFDHYMSTRDMVGYKAVLGNLSLMPILSKVSEGSIEPEDDVNDYMLHVQYDNPETDLSLGLFYQLRVATGAGNDTPVTAAAPTKTDGFKSQNINLFVGEKWGNVGFGLEGGFNTGETGLQRAGNAGGVKINSYGLAADLNLANPESRWNWMARAGIASGDDPGTADAYEGFTFNRNYNVGMLLFNHPLGQGDHLRTSLIRNTAATASTQIDTEAVSNVIYLAPGFQHRWKERLHWGATFVWGMFDKAAYTGMEKDLGYELDLNVTYKPYDKMSWITELGMLAPGEGWKAGPTSNSQFENKFVYGISTKAAISF